MKFTKSLLIGTGSVVLAGFILTLLAPKALHGLAATLVQVANTTSNPAIVSRMDDPGRIPYQSTNLTPSLYNANSIAEFTFGPIPANHRLVVQHIAFFLAFPANAQATIEYTSDANYVLGGIPFAPGAGIQFPVGSGAMFDAPTQFYVDPGGYLTVKAFILTNGAAFNTNVAQAVTIIGYLLDCSAAPCSAIAH